MLAVVTGDSAIGTFERIPEEPAVDYEISNETSCHQINEKDLSPACAFQPTQHATCFHLTRTPTAENGARHRQAQH